MCIVAARWTNILSQVPMIAPNEKLHREKGGRYSVSISHNGIYLPETTEHKVIQSLSGLVVDITFSVFFPFLTQWVKW